MMHALRIRAQGFRREDEAEAVVSKKVIVVFILKISQLEWMNCPRYFEYNLKYSCPN